MILINYPEPAFNIKKENGKEIILDTLRKKWVALSPEEWVRQNFIQYLINEGKYPSGLLGIEVMFRLNKLKRRVDILVHDRSGNPILIVECKSPDIKIDEIVFEQIATYNMKYKVPYLIVTNGIHHYACTIDHIAMKFEYLLVIPLYEDLIVSKV